jgi:hypothetical protein
LRRFLEQFWPALAVLLIGLLGGPYISDWWSNGRGHLYYDFDVSDYASNKSKEPGNALSTGYVTRLKIYNFYEDVNNFAMFVPVGTSGIEKIEIDNPSNAIILDKNLSLGDIDASGNIKINIKRFESNSKIDLVIYGSSYEPPVSIASDKSSIKIDMLSGYSFGSMSFFATIALHILYLFGIILLLMLYCLLMKIKIVISGAGIDWHKEDL